MVLYDYYIKVYVIGKTVTLMLYDCYINDVSMSTVSLLCVHKWVSLVKHIKGIYILLGGFTILVCVFIILLKMIYLRDLGSIFLFFGEVVLLNIIPP